MLLMRLTAQSQMCFQNFSIFWLWAVCLFPEVWYSSNRASLSSTTCLSLTLQSVMAGTGRHVHTSKSLFWHCLLEYPATDQETVVLRPRICFVILFWSVCTVLRTSWIGYVQWHLLYVESIKTATLSCTDSWKMWICMHKECVQEWDHISEK